jgi:hypothetical protein
MTRMFVSLLVCIAPLAAACGSAGSATSADLEVRDLGVQAGPTGGTAMVGDPGVSNFRACCTHCDSGGSCSGCSSTDGACGTLKPASCSLVDNQVTNCHKETTNAGGAPAGAGSFTTPKPPPSRFQACCEGCSGIWCSGCNDVPDGTACKSPRPMKANCRVVDGEAICTPP